jgi:hypothetical protein
LPKSRSVEIAIAENGLLFVMDRPAVAKQKIIIWKDGRSRPPKGTARQCSGRTKFLIGRVNEYEAVSHFGRAMLPRCLASAKLGQRF